MDYSKSTVLELKSLCKERFIKGYSSKKRDELIKLLTTDESHSDSDSKFTKMKVVELKELCKKECIKGYSTKKRDELITLLSEAKKTVAMSDDVITHVADHTAETVEEHEEVAKEDFQLIHGDCLVEMTKIPDKSINMILCDLPYGMTKNPWDVVIPFDKLWEQYNRIIKTDGAIVLFGSQPFTSLLITSNLTDFRYSLVWEKNKFSDFLNAKRKPMKTNEDIAIFYKKQPVYNPQYWYSTPYTRWNTQSAVDKQTNYGSHKENFVESKDGKRLPTTVLKFNRVERPDHPTQKPVDLLEWLIKTYTNESDLVLDNCMGVGSTGVACKNTKRKFIGIEIEKSYYDIAKASILE